MTMRRSIAAWLAGRASMRRRPNLRERVRASADDRRVYDLAVDALREFERRDVAAAELELVEAWLFDEPGAAIVPARVGAAATPRRLGWLRWLTAGVAGALAAAAVVVLLVRDREGDGDPFGVKGPHRDAVLAIDVLCGPSDPSVELHSAARDGCSLDGSLSFAYRIEPTARASGALTLFGIDDAGRVLYYVPTPKDPSPVRVSAGRWEPLATNVALAVNHRVGTVRLYALLSPVAPTVNDIDEAASMLVDREPASPGDPPWHESLGSHGAIAMLCEGEDACHSAESTFEIEDR